MRPCTVTCKRIESKRVYRGAAQCHLVRMSPEQIRGSAGAGARGEGACRGDAASAGARGGGVCGAAEPVCMRPAPGGCVPAAAGDGPLCRLQEAPPAVRPPQASQGAEGHGGTDPSLRRGNPMLPSHDAVSSTCPPGSLDPLHLPSRSLQRILWGVGSAAAERGRGSTVQVSQAVTACRSSRCTAATVTTSSVWRCT